MKNKDGDLLLGVEEAWGMRRRSWRRRLDGEGVGLTEKEEWRRRGMLLLSCCAVSVYPVVSPPGRASLPPPF